MVRVISQLLRDASSRTLSLTARLGSQLPYAKHLFPMKTTFRHCLLINYSMDPAVLARSLPRGLTPDTVDTPEGKRAFLSVVVADLVAMRPGFLPRAAGSDFTQVVYRAIVRSPTGERGVHFVRSDADDWMMSAAGNVLSNFNFNRADCIWSGRAALSLGAERALAAAGGDDAAAARPEVELREWLDTPSTPGSKAPRGGDGERGGEAFAFMLEPRGGGGSEAEAEEDSGGGGGGGSEPAGVRLSLDPASASLTMPQSSAFRGSDVREAQRFFVELYAAFASWPQADHWSAVRIDRTFWKVVSLEPSLCNIDFMERSRHFRPGEASLGSCSTPRLTPHPSTSL